MARLTAPNGTVVSVDDEKVDAMVARGFKPDEAEKAPAKKATARKAAAKK